MSMRALRRLLLKELRELLRPRYLLPLLVAPMLFIALAQGFGAVQQELADEPKIALVNVDTGEYAAVFSESLREHTQVIYSANGSEGSVSRAIERAREANADAVVVVPAGFTERIKTGGRGRIETYAIVSEISLVGTASELQQPLAEASRNVTMAATGATTSELKPVERTRRSVVKGTRMGLSVNELSTVLTSRVLIIPLVISIVILFSGQMVINAMGTEKENRTLEMLLSMPIDRRSIVIAKLLGSASIGLIGAVLYAGAFFYYLSSVATGSNGTSELALSGIDYALIGVSLVFALIGALAVALCLGIFAEDRQGAQTFVLPLGAFTFVPAAVTAFTEVGSLSWPLQLLVYAIPFTHPVIAPKKLLFGDPTVVIAGIAYEALFAIATVGLAVRVLDSDWVITGSTNRVGRYLKRIQR